MKTYILEFYIGSKHQFTKQIDANNLKEAKQKAKEIRETTKIYDSFKIK